MKTYPYYLANRPQSPNSDLDIIDKFSGKTFAKAALADKKVINAAIAAADNAAEPMRRLHAYERRDILAHCVDKFKARTSELAEILCLEAGKPIRDSRGEVARLIDTFRIAMEESTRLVGEVLPLDTTERTKNYQGMWKRVPVGPCSFISPFNFPLNLVAHKVAPAIAAGCPFVLKPASRTPIGALIIGEVLSQTALPEGAFSILPCHRDGADLFTTDERLKLLSFTGSPGVGWDLKSKAGKKKVVLELGGNAACIVEPDWDIQDAVDRIIVGAFYQSGQSCISVQRIYIHESIYEKFKQILVKATQNLVSGDPKDEKTFIGPLISEDDAKRLETWIESAVKKGGKLLCGGKRKGSVLEATLLEEVPESEKICADEAFGPVAVLSPYKTFEEAIRKTNHGVFGLQAGVFTRDIFKGQQAWNELEVGGVVLGDVPSWRADHMPYGGVKDSGLGREGIRFAMEDMTEIRLLVTRTPPTKS